MLLSNFSLIMSRENIDPAVSEMEARVETEADMSSTSIIPKSTDGRLADLSILGTM